MNKVDRLFFDVGSTLVNETECYNHRIRDAVNETDVAFEQFNEKRIFLAKQNLKGDIEAIKLFGLTKTPWHIELIYGEHVAKVREYGYEISGQIANKTLYDYLGIEFSLIPSEMETVFWDSASAGAIMPDC